jgi:hypothetical protein
MQISPDRLRKVSLAAVEVAETDALNLVDEGAGWIDSAIDVGSRRAAAGIGRLLDGVPEIAVVPGQRKPKRSRRKMILLFTGGVVAVVLVVWRGRLLVRRHSEDIDAPTPAPDPDHGAANGARFDVVPASQGGWDVTSPDVPDRMGHEDTQAEGVIRARQLAADAGGGEVVIHGVDGTARDIRSVPPSG